MAHPVRKQRARPPHSRIVAHHRAITNAVPYGPRPIRSQHPLTEQAPHGRRFRRHLRVRGRSTRKTRLHLPPEPLQRPFHGAMSHCGRRYYPRLAHASLRRRSKATHPMERQRHTCRNAAWTPVTDRCLHALLGRLTHNKMGDVPSVIFFTTAFRSCSSTT
jgi:hypothetical protein